MHVDLVPLPTQPSRRILDTFLAVTAEHTYHRNLGERAIAICNAGSILTVYSEGRMFQTFHQVAPLVCKRRMREGRLSFDGQRRALVEESEIIKETFENSPTDAWFGLD